MKPIILNADYMIPQSAIPEVDDNTEIHFTRFGSNKIPGGIPSFIDDTSYKIFCNVNEPSTSRWVETAANIIKYSNYYDKIVTSDVRVLKECSNAVFMPYGTTWLNKSNHHPDSFGEYSDNLSSLIKDFSLSMVCGSLTGKPGYNLRHIVFANKDDINIKKKFYSSTRFPLEGYPTLPDDNKIYLFNSMYSIAIESTSELNYFSEKLIDCLITKTIPVYWGCPNISDFFDTTYWIDMRNILNFEFTEKYYYDNLDKIIDNFNRAIPYCDNLFKRVINI